MLVLGLDTATPATSVALCAVEPATGHFEVLARHAVEDPRHSAEVLVPLISRALAEWRRVPGDLDALVAGVGPGPYTSLRVGVVTAASLGDALRVPVYGVCSLDGFVTAERSGAVAVVTDARRREVYWARYRSGERVDGPHVGPAAQLALALDADERVIGAGAELYAAEFGQLGAVLDETGPRYPDPAELVRRAMHRLNAPAMPLEPLYLRRPDATPRAVA